MAKHTRFEQSKWLYENCILESLKPCFIGFYIYDSKIKILFKYIPKNDFTKQNELLKHKLKNRLFEIKIPQESYSEIITISKSDLTFTRQSLAKYRKQYANVHTFEIFKNTVETYKIVIRKLEKIRHLRQHSKSHRIVKCDMPFNDTLRIYVSKIYENL